MKFNAQQMAFLLGLAAIASLSAKPEELTAAVEKLTAEQKTQLEALADKPGQTTPASGNGAGEPGNGQGAAGDGAASAGAANGAAAAGSTTLSTPTGNANDVGTAVQTALAAERARTEAIETLGTRAGVDPTVIRQHIRQGTSAERFQQVALDALCAANRPVSGMSGHVSGGEDGRVSLAAGVTDALALRAGVVIAQPHARAAEFRHRRLIDVGREFLQQLGVTHRGMGDYEVAQLCLGGPQALARHVGYVALSHSSSDFPGLLANTLRKILLDGYEQEASTWEAWASEMEVADFKPVKLLQIGATPVPPKVLEGAEYTYASLGEGGETVTVAKYGHLLAFTWELMVNDDLGAFSDQAYDFSGGARALEGDLMYAALTSNPTLATDSTALFHANHTNLSSGGAAAIGLASLDAARVAMRKQKGLETKSGAADGRRLALRPEILLCPEGKVSAAMQLLASLVDPSKNNATPNYQFVRSLTPVSDPRLDENSTTAWYLAANKRRNGAKMAFLRGYRRPFIGEIQTGTSVDGVTYKLRHVAGSAMTDYRGWQKNAGA